MEASSSDRYYIDLLNSIVSRIFQYGNLPIYILGTVGDLLSIGIFSPKEMEKKRLCFLFPYLSLLKFSLSKFYHSCHFSNNRMAYRWRHF